jgi:hypothetical protein
MLNCRLPVPQAKAFVACREITTAVVNKLTDSAVHTLAMDTFKSSVFAKPMILLSGDLRQRILCRRLPASAGLLGSLGLLPDPILGSLDSGRWQPRGSPPVSRSIVCS